jgi:hypothetical protein
MNSIKVDAAALRDLLNAPARTPIDAQYPTIVSEHGRRESINVISSYQSSLSYCKVQ